MKFQQSRIKRILQIAPVCEAVDAVFSEGYGEAVVVWGLVETVDGTTEIHGFTTEPSKDGFGLRSAEEDTDFEYYIKLSECQEVCLGRIDDGDNEKD